MTGVSPRTAARAAYAAAGANAAAAAAMLLWLRRGLPIQGSELRDRMTYVVSNRGAWVAGWLLWNAAAIALVAFYLGLAGLWRERAPIRCGLALLCAAAGLAADLGAEAIYMIVAPALGPEAFAVAEKTAGALTGFLGNGLYTIGGVLLTTAGAGELPRRLVGLAAAVWIAGASLAASSLAESPAGQFWTTAALMPLFVVWAVLVGRWLNRAS